MDNKERLRKWLWLGLDETTAKKYQRKISAENVRIVRNESVAMSRDRSIVYNLYAGVIPRIWKKSGLHYRSNMDVLHFSLYTELSEKAG